MPRGLLVAQVRPDGSGLRRVFDSHGGLANHPKFSPKFTPEAGRIVFTSDYAGYSAEEIALPHQFQPYGDLYAINIDGTDLQRLTHGRHFFPNITLWSPDLSRGTLSTLLLSNSHLPDFQGQAQLRCAYANLPCLV